MRLVEAGSDDLDALVDRWYSLAKGMEAYDELNRLAYDDVDDVSADGFREHLADDDITDYLIVDESETVGFLTLQEGHHPSREYSQYLRIVNLAVDEGHRGEGYGTAVVERVKEMARERGCDHLKVSCEWANDGARRFYRDSGFRPKQVDYVQEVE